MTYTGTKPWESSEAAVMKLVDDMEMAELRHDMLYRGFIAQSRRLFGKPVSSDTRAASAILIELSRKGLIIREDCGSDDGLTVYERAAVTAIALYAGGPRGSHVDDTVNDSSIDVNRHRFGNMVGNLNNTLAKAGGVNQGIESALSAIIKSDDDFVPIVYDMARLIRRAPLKSLDYKSLVTDLIAIQREESRSRQKIMWTKEFIVSTGSGQSNLGK